MVAGVVNFVVVEIVGAHSSCSRCCSCNRFCVCGVGVDTVCAFIVVVVNIVVCRVFVFFCQVLP